MYTLLLYLVIIVLSQTSFGALISDFTPKTDRLFPVSLIHVNDFHARFEETNIGSEVCKTGEQCIGGYARTVTVVKHLLNVKQDKNPLYMNAGDYFQGTFWYTVGRWNVTSHFLNLLPADVMTLGNHEFDDDINGIVPFLENIKSPIVVANIDDSNEPDMQNKYKKSIIIDKYERKIGVIGVITSETAQISHPGKLKFLDEVSAVKDEAMKMKCQGIDIIIVLSHCGLEVDYMIAKELGTDIDVIVGGHSHTYMFNDTVDKPNPNPDFPHDKYPAVIENSNGHKTLIVQASSYARYVGDITIYFDRNGNIVEWNGEPIFLKTNIVKDPQIMHELIPWRNLINEQAIITIGESRVELNRTECYFGECNIGNLFTNSYVHYYTMNETTENGTWTKASIGLMNAGGMRSSLRPGDIQYGDMVTCIPFANTIDLIDLKGKYLKEALEYSVSESWNPNVFIPKYMLQVSGIRVVYNVTKQPFQRIVSMNVLNRDAFEPAYEPLDENKMYRIAVPTFLIEAGDNFTMIRDHMENHSVGPVDIDVLTDYTKYKNVITNGIEGRITFLE